MTATVRVCIGTSNSACMPKITFQMLLKYHWGVLLFLKRIPICLNYFKLILWQNIPAENNIVHLFNTIAVVDRIVPLSQDLPNVDMNCDVDADRFVPSVEEQNLLMNELVFIVASSVISNLPQMRVIFEKNIPKAPSSWIQWPSWRNNKAGMHEFYCTILLCNHSRFLFHLS